MHQSRVIGFPWPITKYMVKSWILWILDLFCPLLFARDEISCRWISPLFHICISCLMNMCSYVFHASILCRSDEMTIINAIEYETQSISVDTCGDPVKRTVMSILNRYFLQRWPKHVFLAATKQQYEWFILSVRLSHLFQYVPIIVLLWNLQELLPMVHAKGQCQRSKVNVTEVKTQLSRFGTETPVWIHIWWWNDAQRMVLFRRGALLLRPSVKVQGHKQKQNLRFWPILGVSGLMNSPMATIWCTKLETT